jgi:hypothetical protein
MPKSMLPFVVLGFVLAPSNALAVDECLSKPNAAAPKGQHWYYRTDRANNSRQCWRLGPEGLRIQRSESQIRKNKSQAAVQPEPPPPTQRPATIGMAIASADASAVGAAGTAPSTGWLDVTKFADSPPASQPAAEAPVEPTLSAVASDTEPQGANRVIAGGGDVSSTGSDDLVAQHVSTTHEPASEADDHTLALLTAMFVFLATAGLIVHYFERRRRKRAARGFEPPQRAPVVTMKTADPGALIPLPSSAEIGKSLLPPPPSSADQTEKLTNALQQLLDRLQTELNLERQAMHSARTRKVQ